MQLVVCKNKVLAYGPNGSFINVEGGVVCNATGRSFQNSTTLTTDTPVPADIDTTNYEYEFGVFTIAPWLSDAQAAQGIQGTQIYDYVSISNNNLSFTDNINKIVIAEGQRFPMVADYIRVKYNNQIEYLYRITAITDNQFTCSSSIRLQGDTGATGSTGAAAGFGTPTASVDNAVGTPSVTITASGANTSKVFNFAFKNLKGNTGSSGSAATISVGNTTTGAAGTNASVTNSGTSSAAVLNFTIPRGQKGDTGSAGVSITGATLTLI